MKIGLPDETGRITDYRLVGVPVAAAALGAAPARVVYSAAHVVADPFTGNDPSGRATVDWERTMAFRRHLAGLGLGIAEAMDTAQRGMGLDWAGALELIARTKAELPDALVANGCGTDHLGPGPHSLDAVRRAYLEQVEAIQAVGGRIILMASRALVAAAKGPEDYLRVYSEVLAACDAPVILHWLGEMFDPALVGYWGAASFDEALQTALGVIGANVGKVDGIKISLLDKDKEIAMRRRLPSGVRMYTGDDFNYPELIEGDAIELTVGAITGRYVVKEGDTADELAAGLQSALTQGGLNGSDFTLSTAGGVLTVANNTNVVTDVAIAATRGEGALAGLADIDVTADPADALDAIEGMLQTSINSAASFGSAQKRLDIQAEFVSGLTDSLKSGIGSMVDANMEEASARLQALQVQQQLATQSLSIANQAPQSILSLFR